MQMLNGKLKAYRSAPPPSCGAPSTTSTPPVTPPGSPPRQDRAATYSFNVGGRVAAVTVQISDPDDEEHLNLPGI